MDSLKNVVEKANGDYEGVFWIHFGDFLDWFYSSKRTKEDRFNSVKDEPNFIKYEDWQKAFIAASVNKICDDYRVSNPKWVFKKEYFLKEPYFSLNTKSELRIYLLLESPVQFRMRDLYVFNNVLSRC